MKNKIIIVAGDPNSINSEIISKVWKKINLSIKKKIYVISNFNLLNKQFKIIKSKVSTIQVKQIDDNLSSNKLKIINIPLSFKDSFNVPLRSASNYIKDCFDLAHKLSQNKDVKGLINCPVNKRLLHRSKKIGVTELLASMCKIKDHSEVMLIHNKKLSVLPLTTHIEIKNVSKKITNQLIKKKLNTLQKNFKKLFNKNPKIGVVGLNPHNSELASNSEEKKIIIPAITSLKKIKLNIEGPFSSDTLFIRNYKKYDVIVGMYHDQILTPFKTLFHYDAINLTLGLKYIRVSPDHGPARDIVKKNQANYLSLLKCIKFINNIT